MLEFCCYIAFFPQKSNNFVYFENFKSQISHILESVKIKKIWQIYQNSKLKKIKLKLQNLWNSVFWGNTKNKKFSKVQKLKFLQKLTTRKIVRNKRGNSTKLKTSKKSKIWKNNWKVCGIQSFSKFRHENIFICGLIKNQKFPNISKNMGDMRVVQNMNLCRMVFSCRNYPLNVHCSRING